MKKYQKISRLFSLILIFCFLFISPNLSFAHLPGQPPFFKVDGVYSILYPVPSTSLEEFVLPQDLATGIYLVNKPVSFELDIAVLPVLPEIVGDTKFTWDFGDGTTGVGLKNSHTYTKMGSYLLTIDASYQGQEPQLIQSTMIHILPDSSYQLPEYKIMVKNNGDEWKTVNDPLLDIIKGDFKNSFEFSKTPTKTPSVELASVFWDFGDQASLEQADFGKNPTHKYNPSMGQVFPVLRITDQNGFIVDTFAQINNDDTPVSKKIVDNFSNPKSSQNKIWMVVVGLGILTLIYGGYFFFKKNISKKRK